MTYQITVPKIHCSGCVNLIKISLEEEFSNISVDEPKKTVRFESSQENPKEKLDSIFDELRSLGYEYENLIKT